MRLISLSVQRFQCIESAELEFGPGLNILYGPNDLGKSSLAWAIRAVLLLLHNSTHHERFVSWYSGEEPKVQLTFADASGRAYRVTKIFGGSSGRSLLEVAKDGRVFTTDCKGRQVDEKLRSLLGWGIPAPGGSGAGRSFPNSFLAQVLLSEQDSVRKVLFDTSLAEDGDESGRERLTAALGALAQDPLFKTLLDAAQENVDRAFTPTGRRRSAAGSPFVAIDERIKRRRQEISELEAKVRETVAAEGKITLLTEQRDKLLIQLTEARRIHADSSARHQITKRRNELEAQIAQHQSTLDAARDLKSSIETMNRAIEALNRELAEAAKHSEAQDSQRQRHADACNEARVALDNMALVGTEDHRLAELREKLELASENCQEAKRALERASQAAQTARVTAALVDTARAVVAPSTRTASTATSEVAKALESQRKTRASLEEAQQRLREATSDDKARERMLRRAELDKRRLSAVAERTNLDGVLQSLTALSELEQRAAGKVAAVETTIDELDSARDAIEDLERQIAIAENTLASASDLQNLASLRQVEHELQTAREQAKRAEDSRVLSVSLREKSNALKGAIPRGLPSAAEMSDLHQLYDELRVAEARLGGGLSIRVRPRRAIQLESTIDGSPSDARSIRQDLTISADRQATLVIDELVDIQITAGEASARVHANELRTRWDEARSSKVEPHGCQTLEELQSLVDTAASSESMSESLLREAEVAEQRARDLMYGPDLEELEARLRERRLMLGERERVALEQELIALGDSWSRTLQARASSAGQIFEKLSLTRDEEKLKLARIEQRLESEREISHQLLQQLTTQRSALGEVSTRDIKTRITQVDASIAEVDAELAALSGPASDDSLAHDAVERAKLALEDATRILQAKEATARNARDAQVQAEAKLDAARANAIAFDVERVWESALAQGVELPLIHWTRNVESADDALARCNDLHATVRNEIELHQEARTRALQQARDRLRREEQKAALSQQSLDAARKASQERREELTQNQLAVAELREKLAAAHVESARASLETLRAELETLPPGNVSEEQVEEQRLLVQNLETQAHNTDQELARARGALEQVGGAAVRELQKELTVALNRDLAREREIDLEYTAWKLLVDTLREAESKEGAHLGRALSAPVNKRFRDLTGGRYGALELGTQLEADGLQVAGQVRELGVLSAGTQDQLATLLRLCVAEQLRTGLVLDDHLSQSDPERVGWFNSILRNASHQIQIVFLTCRPLEVLSPSELPDEGEWSKNSVAGQVRAIDLSKVIRRFANKPPAHVPTHQEAV